jgi:hypothetical protein
MSDALAPPLAPPGEADPEAQPHCEANGAPARLAGEAPPDAPVVTSPRRYRVQFTADQAFVDLLSEARDLLWHQLPDGDLASVQRLALEALVARLRRRKYAATQEQAQASSASPAPVPARHPPSDAPARRDAASPTAPAPARRNDSTPTAPVPASDASSGEASAGSPGAAESVAWTPDAALARSHDAAPAPPSPSLPGDSAPARCNAEAPAMTALTPGDLRARVPSSSAQASVPRPHVPAAVRREVWQREGACCTFVDERGVRCRATAALEFHHEHAHALGGPSTPGNLTLRCRAHNRLAAELDFGADRVAEQIARARGPSGATP